jgi:hypothetical protein
MDPDDISRALGVKPKVKWKAGDRRSTPTGQLLEGTNEHTYWCSEAIRGTGWELSERLTSQVVALYTHEDFLRRFSATGGTVEYSVGCFGDRENIGITLEADLLKRLGNLDVELSLDIYCGAELPGTDT